ASMPPSPSSRSLGRRASCSAACGPCCNPPPLRLTRCGGDVSIPTREKPMRVVRWARLQSAAPCGLRLGAWYPVTGLTAREAQVQVRGRVLMVPRSLLELRTTPPLEPRAPLHRAPTELGRPRTRRAADGGAPQAHGPAQWSGSSRRDGTAAQGRELVAGVSCAVSKPRAPNTA